MYVIIFSYLFFVNRQLFPHLGYSEKEHESTDNSSVFLVNTAMQIDKLQKLTLSYTVQMHSQASFKFTVLTIIFKANCSICIAPVPQIMATTQQ